MLMIILFAFTSFLSAFLLFFIQPMVGKLVLPVFGGTPGVWLTCLVFFQFVLLLGYLYAHALSKLGGKIHLIIHLGIMLLPLMVLPIHLVLNPMLTQGTGPLVNLLILLTLTAGLPFFVVSGSAPLLQKWFSGTRHPASKDPYFLYAASNTGSILALLGYPVLIEPWLGLTGQGTWWTCGYVVLIVLFLLGITTVWRSPRGFAETNSAADQPDTDRPTIRRRLFWLFASFVPSSLLLGVSAHLSINVIAMPLLWVLPLAVYLLTFILVFSPWPILPHRWLMRYVPLGLLPLGAFLFMSVRGTSWLQIPIHLILFFLLAMICHGELARSRPSPKHLTEFYLWMSVGGVLGGIFNAIIAPAIFVYVVEYPLAVVLACLLLPRKDTGRSGVVQHVLDYIVPLGLAAANYGLALWLSSGTSLGSNVVFALMFAPGVLLGYFFLGRPVRFALVYGVMLASVAWAADLKNGHTIYVTRDFFGVKRVLVDPTNLFHKLVHGNTLHGAQFIDPTKHDEPLTYFHRSGPLGDIFRITDQRSFTQPIGVIGLGVGSVATYAHPGQSVTFFEIDPEVEHIARDRRLFTFLSDSHGTCRVVVGDGRLTISREPDHTFGLMVLDAFSSDNIPIHLLTREAVQLYQKKLIDNGVMVFHISNRFVDFSPMLGQMAREMGLQCINCLDEVSETESEQFQGKTTSHYLVMSRNLDFMNQLTLLPRWRKVPSQPEEKIWTDDWSHLLALFKWSENSLSPYERVPN